MNQTVASVSHTAALLEIKNYIFNIRRFTASDWRRYVAWIGTTFSLFVGTTAFVSWGYLHDVVWPGYVWFIPGGTAMFCLALAIDDIGHRTLYKHDLKAGEGVIHKMIVGTAVPSVVALCLCYEHGETFRVPAIALIALSLFYSGIDELLHWRRYLEKGIDRVEVWAHFFAIMGHVLMISCWWHWYAVGYPGVAETLATLPK